MLVETHPIEHVLHVDGQEVSLLVAPWELLVEANAPGLLDHTHRVRLLYLGFLLQHLPPLLPLPPPRPHSPSAPALSWIPPAASPTASPSSPACAPTPSASLRLAELEDAFGAAPLDGEVLGHVEAGLAHLDGGELGVPRQLLRKYNCLSLLCV
eukprot:CAMPEP_0202979942 /NCGR_PEP_ID=MMETSP1396-20130829/85957_1 /ASSEMBLY_ACC=CAM_ASM_000872 /TAXON_ID= /ORGANISM="Pseudokeronopsis sp., Strain Brazil" /LENGTH=153 /DNA_ID=CAMNT_0049719599 /DNA_START=279 /DNA_END=741 /DNA_ORIENTATION=+